MSLLPPVYPRLGIRRNPFFPLDVKTGILIEVGRERINSFEYSLTYPNDNNIHIRTYGRFNILIHWVNSNETRKLRTSLFTVHYVRSVDQDSTITQCHGPLFVDDTRRSHGGGGSVGWNLSVLPMEPFFL